MAEDTLGINPMSGEPISVESLNRAFADRLPGYLGMSITAIDAGSRSMSARLEIAPHHLAPNGYLHAATVIALADTLCGSAALTFRPEGSSGFTTIELKTNFAGTAREGAICGTAQLLHGGRTTQVWETTVLDEASGRPIAFFRCTQLMLYPDR